MNTKQIETKKEKKRYSPKERGLDYFMLNYFFHHPDTPFNSKILHFILKSTGYKLNYIQVQLSFNRRKGFLYEPVSGIFMMRAKDFQVIEEKNPNLAKQIMVKSEFAEAW